MKTTKKIVEGSPLQKFFDAHPEINTVAFAKRINMNTTLLRNYINGFKRPSPERVKQIQDRINELGREYAETQL